MLNFINYTNIPDITVQSFANALDTIHGNEFALCQFGQNVCRYSCHLNKVCFILIPHLFITSPKLCIINLHIMEDYTTTLWFKGEKNHDFTKYFSFKFHSAPKNSLISPPYSVISFSPHSYSLLNAADNIGAINPRASKSESFACSITNARVRNIL